MKTTIHAGVAVLALLLAGGCASVSYSRMERPTGTSALGLSFGQPREAVEASLRAQEIPFSELPGDPDSLLASRCPSAPSNAPCRLVFGPRGLYAAQIEAPAGDEGRLVSAAEEGLGSPTRSGGDAAKREDSANLVVATWDRDGWTVGVTRHAPPDGTPTAELRVELDAASPPVVVGVPLGRRRAVVERALEMQGAVVVQRDDEATTYLGCPKGDGSALTCVVSFAEDRASAVTEVYSTPAADDEALAAWRVLSGRWAAEIGRPPATFCPETGPERATGDCTSTWGSERLVVVVGAHRNAGGDHRGVISVYTSWNYPLGATGSAPAREE